MKIEITVQDTAEAITTCRLLVKAANAIELAMGMHDIERQSITALLCRIRDSVKVQEGETK